MKPTTLSSCLALHLLLLGAAAAGCATHGAWRPPAGLPVSEGVLTGAGGVRLFYRQVGTGAELVVYLHGGPGSNFRGNGTEMDALARGRRLVMYDQRGSGSSELIADRARLRMADHVTDLEAVRAHFGARRMALIGLSWGAGVAVHYAAAHPDRVSRLLLISPMPLTRQLLVERRQTLATVVGPTAAARMRQIRESIGAAGDAEALALCRELSDLVFRAYLSKPSPAALGKAAMRCDIPAAAIRNRPLVEEASMGSLGDWDFAPLLGRIGAPALVLEGAESNVPLAPTRRWAELLPDARFHLIPGAGHELFLDQPALFLEAAEEFLREPAD